MAKNSPEKADTWTAKLLDEKPFRLATGDSRHGQQIRSDHLGATDETGGIPAADRLILPRDTRRLM